MAVARTHPEAKRRVERGLRDDICLDVDQVTVAVDRGAVHLRGSVPNYLQKLRAVADARLLAGPTSVVDELTISPAGPIPDDEVKRHVEDALVRDHRLTDVHPGSYKLVSKEVSVEVRDGTVVLTGLVDRPAERHLVEEDVWTLPGVRGIEDRIVVAPLTARPDEDIRRDVVESLRANPRIDSSKVEVAVRDQMATLSGEVPAREQKRLAGDAAWWVPGVRDVRNDLRVGG